MNSGGDGPAVSDSLKPFLGSTIFVVPWISWQAWVLGASFRQRRGQLVADREAGAGGGGAAGGGTSTQTAGTTTATAASDSAHPSTPAPVPRRWRPVIFVVGETLLFLFAQAWLGRVLTHVPEPYLDEVFHIPQAQKYCEGKWSEWDDKITTPPGLYLFSVLYKELWSVVDGCSVWALRGANNIAIMLVAVATCSCRAEIEHQAQLRIQTAEYEKQGGPDGNGKGKSRGPLPPPRKLSDSVFSVYAFHTALNVALFPVLFFFSALYYTDVYSTLVTLAAYRVHLFRLQPPSGRSGTTPGKPPPVWSGVLAVVLGLAALAMRQTNIFWVAVYMGGLEGVLAVKSLRGLYQESQSVTAAPVFATPLTAVRFYARRYSLGDIHDPPLGESWPDDWLLSLVSIGVAAVCHPVQVLLHVWPYVVVLASFGGFVVWNGGVVLGDKSNHVATLHLAQMLYIWPLFAFFSAPLFVSHAVVYVRRLVGGSVDKQPAKTPDQPAEAASSSSSTTWNVLSSVFAKKMYYPLYLAAVLGAMLAIVRYNTIVHPFTLADNRHYMFYVFRYTIRRAGWLRYALVPVYAVCSWACWRVLWGTTAAATGEFVCSPFATASRAPPAGAAKPAKPASEKTRGPQPTRRSKRSSAKDKMAAAAGSQESQPDAAVDPDTAIFFSFLDEEPAAAAAQAATTTSTALLWLLATTLSLMTAPLVEPRYFILPWVFWRLLVPAVPTMLTETPPPPRRTWAALLANKLDVRLALETLWFCAVSAATMYIFLTRPYVWRAEDGGVLDGGRLQRFMW